MLWVGLTGCLGCGKSTVAGFLRDIHGLKVISADEISHTVLKSEPEVHQSIFQRWGFDYNEYQDFLDYRQAIAQKVFQSQEDLVFLESLLHPKIRQKTSQLKDELSKKHKMAFYDVPLLFEKNMQEQFDRIIGVFTNKQEQKQRLKKRSQWSDDEIEKRIHTQMNSEKKRPQCDFVIENNKDLKALELEVQKVVENLLKT